MQTIRYLIDSSFKLFTSRIIVTIIGIIYLSITARYLSKQEMAVVALIFVLSALVNLLRNFGFVGTAAKLIPEYVALGKESEANRLIRSTMFYLTISAGIITLILFIFSSQVSYIFLKTRGYSSHIKIISGIIFFISLLEPILWFFNSLKKFNISSLFYILEGILPRMFAVIFMFIYGLKGFLWGMLFGYIFILVYAIWLLKDRFFSEFTLEPIFQLFKYSLPFYGSGFLRYAFMQLDQLIVGIFFLPEILASYYIAKRFYDIFVQLIDSICLPILPKIGEIKIIGKQKIQESFKKVFKYASYIFIPMSLTILASSKFLLYIIGGEKYLNATSTLMILSIAILFYAYSGICSTFVYMVGEPKIWFKVQAVNGIVNIFCIAGLIYILKLLALPIALGISLFITTFYSIYLLIHDCQIKVEIDFVSLKRILFISIIMILIMFIPQFAVKEILFFPVWFIVGGIVFICLFLKFSPQEEIMLLESIIPAKFLKIYLHRILLFKDE